MTEPGDITVVRVVGQLDLETCPLLEDALNESTPVVVDLSGVTFIGSTGLSVMLAAHERCTGAGHSFQLAAPSAVVSRVLCISGLDQYFRVVDPVPARPMARPGRTVDRQQST